MHAQDAEAAETAESQPLVSVIVPVLNGAEHLRESLDSILEQTYPRLEVIVVDDGSIDATPEIIASYGERIRSLRQTATRGIYGNANDGIALARGDLIGVFHADDVYLPQMVEREVSWLERHPAAAAVFCSVEFFGNGSGTFPRYELPPQVRGNRPLGYGEVLNTLLSRKNAFLACPTALVRADVYRELGVYRDEEFKNTSDLEMWLRIARNYPIGVLEEPLLRYRRGHGSSSERYHRLRTDQERFFRILDLELDRGGRTVATARALEDYEAHRSKDTVMRAITHYILDRRSEALALLRTVKLRRFAASRRVQSRMLVVAASLHLLLRLPRSDALARVFERRWHGRTGPS